MLKICRYWSTHWLFILLIVLKNVNIVYALKGGQTPRHRHCTHVYGVACLSLLCCVRSTGEPCARSLYLCVVAARSSYYINTLRFTYMRWNFDDWWRQSRRSMIHLFEFCISLHRAWNVQDQVFYSSYYAMTHFCIILLSTTKCFEFKLIVPDFSYQC